MIIGHGVDIANLARIKKAYQKNPNFAKKVLTAKELEAFEQLGPKRQIEFLAGRFSAKEAYSKAVGTGIGSYVSFKDLEILNNKQGQPLIMKHPQASKAVVHLSITHDGDFVVTSVILEKVSLLKRCWQLLRTTNRN